MFQPIGLLRVLTIIVLSEFSRESPKDNVLPSYVDHKPHNFTFFQVWRVQAQPLMSTSHGSENITTHHNSKALKHSHCTLENAHYPYKSSETNLIGLRVM